MKTSNAAHPSIRPSNVAKSEKQIMSPNEIVIYQSENLSTHIDVLIEASQFHSGQSSASGAYVSCRFY